MPATFEPNDADDFCHLARDLTGPICGSTVRHHPADKGRRYSDPPDRCPDCMREVCRACLAIWNAYRRTGEWEGTQP